MTSPASSTMKPLLLNLDEVLSPAAGLEQNQVLPFGVAGLQESRSICTALCWEASNSRRMGHLIKRRLSGAMGHLFGDDAQPLTSDGKGRRLPHYTFIIKNEWSPSHHGKFRFRLDAPRFVGFRWLDAPTVCRILLVRCMRWDFNPITLRFLR